MPSEWEKAKRRWPRFRLRGFFIIVAIVAAFLAGRTSMELRVYEAEWRARDAEWVAILETDDGDVIVIPKFDLDEANVENRVDAVEHVKQVILPDGSTRESSYTLLHLKVKMRDIEEAKQVTGNIGFRRILNPRRTVTLQSSTPPPPDRKP